VIFLFYSIIKISKIIKRIGKKKKRELSLNNVWRSQNYKSLMTKCWFFFFYSIIKISKIIKRIGQKSKIKRKQQCLGIQKL
jgi:hypothetical protein